MSECEKQVIVEAGVRTIVGERQETVDLARDETAGPSARTEVLGRDDSIILDKFQEPGKGAGQETAGPSTQAEAFGRDDSDGKAAALETGNLKLETGTVGDSADNDDAPNALETGNSKLETVTGLCHHAMESGVYCQSPAVRGRRFCYSHLRIRGQRIRMARAVAQRQAFKLVLPPLDDMNSVLAALGQVGDALAAGLLPPRQADLLLYSLRQAAAALRWMARPRLGSIRPLTAGAPPLSSSVSDRVGIQGAPPDPSPQGGVGDNQKRLVEEYPGFEAEFGLPAGLDLSQPPHLLFPPGAQEWPSPTGAAATAQSVVHSVPPPSKPRWTKESIALEELDERREHMSEKTYNEQSCKIHARIENMVKTEMRKEKEAEWQAEADRRNALEEKKAQIFRDMDEGQRRAYQLGIMEGIETARHDAEEEARNRKPPKASVDSGRIVGMERLDSR